VSQINTLIQHTKTGVIARPIRPKQSGPGLPRRPDGLLAMTTTYTNIFDSSAGLWLCGGMAFLTRTMAARIIILAFIGGAFVASATDYFIASWRPLLCIAAALVIGGWWFRHHKILAIVYLSLGFTLVGLGWGGYYEARLQAPDAFYTDFDGTGIVVSEPLQKPTYQQLIVALSADNPRQNPRHPRVLVKAETYPLYRYGDEIKFKGKIDRVEAFETDDGKVFDYPKYLLMKFRAVGIVKYPKDVSPESESNGNATVAKILQIKRTLESAITRTLPMPESALARGLLTGGSASFTDAFKLAMQRTGTSHIVAISGYNITIVILIFFLTIRRWAGYWPAIISGFAALAAFVVMTGASASVVRAGIMGSLFLLAKLVGRQNRVDYTVYLAAGAMVALNPLIVRFDAGFQLSFLAILGLVYYSKYFDAGFAHRLPHYRRLGGPVREAVSSTCAAQLVTWPVIAGLSGQISLVAPLVNAILLPLIPFTMAVSFAVALVALASPLVGQTVSLLAWLPLTFFIRVIDTASRLPAAAVSVYDLKWWVVPLWFGMLIGWLAANKLRNIMSQ